MKHLSNHIEPLKELLDKLNLLPKRTSTKNYPLEKAAQIALNNSNFRIEPYKVTSLRPVLETLQDNSSSYYIKPKELSIDLDMPLKDYPSVNLLAEHLKKFKNALHAAKDEQLLPIVEIWGSSISISKDFDDLSLFDFVRTTVGIALCLQNGNGKLRLIGGSISGIQPYLYEILSKSAAKLLKGRSFYVQLLTDSLLEQTLEEFNLSLCHVVYASGGGFYILAPDTEGVEDTFKKFSKHVSEKIYEAHQTALFAELAITKAFDITVSIQALWDELFQNLSKQKYQRLNNNQKFLDEFFNFIEVGGKKGIERDPITNEEFKPIDKKENLYRGDEIQVKRSTKDQIELGKDLRKAAYWVKSQKPFLGSERRTLKDPFGVCHYLVDAVDYETIKNNISAKQSFSLNETKQQRPFIFYGGNKFPIDEFGYVKGFDELAENQDFKRLAIVRMDVDGLGAIFSANIGTIKYKTNWVRYVAVSRSLDQFFKGHLNKLQEPFQQSSVIIYSGGDDLFIVGKWNDIIALSEKINAQFKKWSCGKLTLSGGITILPIKFPIMQGAKLAAKDEKDAKKHSYTEGGKTFEKNAITLFGVPLNWDYEFPTVKGLKEHICNMISSNLLEKSFITKVNIHAEAQKAYLDKKILVPKWFWLMAYDFSRFAERDSVAKEFINEMKMSCVANSYKGSKINSKYPFLQLLRLACRWAELEYRSNKNN